MSPYLFRQYIFAIVANYPKSSFTFILRGFRKILRDNPLYYYSTRHKIIVTADFFSSDCNEKFFIHENSVIIGSVFPAWQTTSKPLDLPLC